MNKGLASDKQKPAQMPMDPLWQSADSPDRGVTEPALIVDVAGFQIIDMPGDSVLLAIDNAVGNMGIIRIHFKSNRLNVFAKLLVI